MMLENAIQIIKPEPDSHFRLRNCSVCEGDNVAYIQLKSDGGEIWHGKCFDCGHMGAGSPVRHYAQAHWNGVKQRGI